MQRVTGMVAKRLGADFTDIEWSCRLQASMLALVQLELLFASVRILAMWTSKAFNAGLRVDTMMTNVVSFETTHFGEGLAAYFTPCCRPLGIIALMCSHLCIGEEPF